MKLLTISGYSAMVKAAVETKYIDEKDVESLQQWREDPENWTPNQRDID